MRKVLDTVQKWWDFVQKMKYGSPSVPTSGAMELDAATGQYVTASEIDEVVDIDQLLKAVRDLEHLDGAANKQLAEVGQSTGQKNLRRILDNFMMSCELRKEKLNRTIAARQISD